MLAWGAWTGVLADAACAVLWVVAGPVARLRAVLRAELQAALWVAEGLLAPPLNTVRLALR